MELFIYCLYDFLDSLDTTRTKTKRNEPVIRTKLTLMWDKNNLNEMRSFLEIY